jgi:two-component system sensor kinase
VYDLSYHYDAAGDRRRALAYALTAAAQARAQFALDVAGQQYTIAHRNADEAPGSVRLRIARGRGEVTLQLGNYDDARHELEVALGVADQPYDVADVTGLLGQLQSNLGNIAESIRFFEEAIRLLGVRVPRTMLGFSWGLMKQTVIQVFHSLFPWRLHRRTSDRTDVLATNLLARIEWSYYANSAIKLLWGSMLGLNRAERVPPSPALSVNYVVHANDMAALGGHRHAAWYYRAAFDVSRELNDQWGMAQSGNHRSMGAYAAAQFEEAIRHAEPGIAAFTKLGDVWELHFAYLNIASGQCALGDLAAAFETSRQLFQSCVIRRDNYLGPGVLFYLMRSSLGRMPFDELVHYVTVSAGNNLSESLILMAEGYWHRAEGRMAKALERFERSWSICRTHFSLMTYNSNALVELVTLLRLHAEALKRTDQRSGASVRRRWRRFARWSNCLAWFLPVDQPHALRELSLVYEHRGRFKKAWKLAAKSCRIAALQKARYEYAQSLLVQSRLAKQLGRPEADDQMRDAQAEIDRIEAAVAAVIPVQPS